MSDAPTTFINTFDVDEDRHDALVDLLAEGASEVIRHRPGFVSASVLTRLDRTRVVIVTQWRSVEDLKATQGDPAAAEYAGRVAAIAQPSPAIFRLAAAIG